MANNKTIRTYQRLVKRIAAEISMLRPDASVALKTRLDKKFKKYQSKIELYTAK